MTRSMFWMAVVALICAGCAGCDSNRNDEDRDLRCDEDCPYGDVSPSLGSMSSFPLRGRIVEEDETPVDITNADPFKMLLQDELDGARVALTLNIGDQRIALAGVRADDEGYIDTRVAIPEAVPDGEHIVEIDVDGQPAADMRVYLLRPDSVDVAVRSDVDMTYMLTDFRSAEGLAQLLESDSRERRALPGMPAVYQALRAGADGQAGRPLCFLSGSPRFFKRTIEGRMQLDGIVHDGIVLKPFKDIVAANLLDFDPQEIAPELEEQIGYKMNALLTLRLDIPPEVPEVLMGDDTEADHVIYALYHRFTSGLLDPAGLEAALTDLAVNEAWMAQIRAKAPQVRDHLAGQAAPVRAIYINHTDDTGHIHEVADWIEPDLTRYHMGAWPLALDLFEDGRISAEQVGTVRDALEAAGVDAVARAAAGADGVQAGFVLQATVDQFAD